ncbi:MAG TPA: TetR/AcrR family transcriptional regulator [Chthoniobacterales bacterium]|jgi:TetR/AcrR family transcriptional repressor of nem operon
MPRISTAKERLTDAALAMMWENSYGATSVDAICERANVKKGSFYYFFKSKAELAAAALEADWKRHQPDLDATFSPTVPPLERFRISHEKCVAFLEEKQREMGAVLGCPLFTVGSEVCCSEETALRDTVQRILDRKICYYESAIRDAHAQGLIHAPDAKAKARALFALIEGALTHSRIQNSLEPLRESYGTAMELLGVKASETVPG